MGMKLRKMSLVNAIIVVGLFLPGALVGIYAGKGHIHDSAVIAVVFWTSIGALVCYSLWFQLFVWRCPSCQAHLGKKLGNHCSNCGIDLRPHH